MFFKGIVVIRIIIGSFFVFFFTCVNACANDVTYRGRVIDVDTKEPIAGAVVVAAWTKERAGIAGPITFLENVKETLTDKEGKWSIVGPEGEEDKIIPGLLSLIGIYMTREPTFIVFKPGYCPWSFSAFGIDACREKLKPSGNDGFIEGETTELPKLTKKEDRLRVHLGPEGDNEDWKKQKEFIRLLNQERRYLGWPEYEIIGGRSR